MILIIAGIAIMALGLNIGLGGVQTLGLQISESFFTITNEEIFNTQDNHIRFIGGIWFCVGALFFLGSIFLNSLRVTLIVLCCAIGIAGLFRLSGSDVLTTEIAPSLTLELIAFPLLGFWLFQSGKEA